MQNDIVTKDNFFSSIFNIIDKNIDQWLMKGALIYIPIAILSAIATFIGSMFFRPYALGTENIILHINNLLISIIKDILDGLVFFGFGKLIEIIKEGFKK